MNRTIIIAFITLVVLTFLLVFNVCYLAKLIKTDVVNNGGLKAITNEIWNGKK